LKTVDSKEESKVVQKEGSTANQKAATKGRPLAERTGDQKAALTAGLKAEKKDLMWADSTVDRKVGC